MVPDSSPSPLSPAASRSHWQHRQVILQRVRHYWIEGVLAPTQLDRARLDIALTECWDLVSYAQERTWDPPRQAQRPLPAGTSLSEYWHHLGPGSSLLLLGEAGGGKTTALLTLGRDLLDLAAADPEHPLPVILNLASWRSHATFTDWLLEELRLRYQLSPTIALSWLDAQALLLLLDGLDEVDGAQRGACVGALNSFKQRHSLLGLVVCSRWQAYAELGEQRLQVQAAIALQPLSWPQVQTYLTDLGPTTATARAIVAQDPALQELMTTPLMVTLLLRAYPGDSALPLSASPTLADRRTQLFETYVERLLGQDKPARPYSPAQMRHWLSRLAYQLTRQSQTTFALDRLQPQWLAINWEADTHWPFRPPTVAPSRAYHTYVTGIVLGCGLLGASLGGLALGAAGAGLGGCLGAAIGWHPRMTDRIEPATELRWSWEGASRGVVVGGLVGVSAGLATGAIGGGLLGLILGGGGGGLMGGLVRPSATLPSSVSSPDPNHGIWRSVQNAAVFGGVGVLLGSVGGAGLAWLLSGQIGAGLLTGGTLMGVLLALHKGGLASLKHLWLRWLLYRQGELPWNCRLFLETSVARLCLQRVGGHYRFSHRLLQTHFAATIAQEYSERIHLNPKDGEAYAKRAALYTTLGDFEAASRDYDRVIALQPDWPEAYAARSWVRYQQGDYLGTLADYAVLLDRAPALAQSLTYKPPPAANAPHFANLTDRDPTSQPPSAPTGHPSDPPPNTQDGTSKQETYPTAALTVLNDDINSFEQVISVLSHYLPVIDRDRAQQLAQTIHHQGQAIVWVGPAPLVALYQIQLQQAGLTVAT